LLSGPSEQRGGWFGSILGDLAECGYDAEWENIPAAAVGAPHRRERVWLVAYPVKTGRPNRSIFGSCGEWVARTHANNLVSSWPSADSWKERTEGRKPQEVSGLAAFSWRQDVRGVEDYFRLPNIPQPLVFRNSDGLPNALDRVGCCGNAVVPQIPELIGRAIMEAEGMT
jgi:DNA (cytosine-5)-methyltransferase 1